MTTTVEEELDAHQATVEAPVGFTPGPWRRGQAGNMRIYGPDGRGEGITGLIADVKRPQDVDLIAMAPTLLEERNRLREALERVIALAHWDDNGEATFRIEQIAREALISKPAEWNPTNDEMLDLENPPSFDELRKAYARLREALGAEQP